MTSTEELRVAAGRIAVTRLYDLAYEIDLDRIERDARASATRLQLTRVKAKAVFHTHPPVDVALGRTELALGGGTVEAEVRARVYDLGVARLSYGLSTESLPWTAYVERVDEMAEALAGPTPWDVHLARLHELVESVLEKPSEEGLETEYVVATVDRFDRAVSSDELVDRVDLVPLVTGETRSLSAATRQEALRHRYSYYEDDLVVIGSARALIVEPAGDSDVADIIETAQAQLLELRYYDDRLDRELPRMYDRIEEARRVGGLGRRRHATLARSLHTLLAEVTEVSERIDNALVVTEDVYLARVYRAALDQYRIHDWRTAVDRKLSIIRDTYTALYDEAIAARAEYLEITIVLLIALEIILAFLVY